MKPPRESHSRRAEKAAIRVTPGGNADDSVVAERTRGAAVTSQDVQLRKAEFTHYLAATQARLYGYIHSLIPDINDADDLYQQTALVLWNKFGEFDRGRDFFAWACGVARGGGRELRAPAGPPAALPVCRREPAPGRGPRGMTDQRTGRPAGRADPVRREAARSRPGAAHRVLPRRADRRGVHAAADRRSRSSHSVYNSLRRIRKALFDCISRTLARRAGPGGK